MKNSLLFITLILGFQTIASAQQKKIVHAHYVSFYNPAKKGPDSVAWDLTPSMVSCSIMARHDAFNQDPSLPGSAKPSDYTSSGFSKGHLFNWDEAKCDGGTVAECFYMTNMLPQYQCLMKVIGRGSNIMSEHWLKSKLYILLPGASVQSGLPVEA
jgi:endonuclease G, mitochondrial